MRILFFNLLFWNKFGLIKKWKNYTMCSLHPDPLNNSIWEWVADTMSLYLSMLQSVLPKIMTNLKIKSRS